MRMPRSAAAIRNSRLNSADILKFIGSFAAAAVCVGLPTCPLVPIKCGARSAGFVLGNFTSPFLYAFQPIVQSA